MNKNGASYGEILKWATEQYTEGGVQKGILLDTQA